MMYMTYLSTIAIYPAKKADLAFLFTEKVEILAKYSDFLNVFLKQKAFILSKATKVKSTCY